MSLIDAIIGNFVLLVLVLFALFAGLFLLIHRIVTKRPSVWPSDRRTFGAAQLRFSQALWRLRQSWWHWRKLRRFWWHLRQRVGVTTLALLFLTVLGVGVLAYTTTPTADPSSFSRSDRTADIKKALIAESIAQYPGPCPCPYSVNRSGRRCGDFSAYSKPGGYDPLCYSEDVTPEMVAAHTGIPVERHKDVKASAGEITCHSPAITDGDTLRCGGHHIRLASIDAPEMPGHCRKGRRCTPGDPHAAKAYLEEITRGPVTCRRIDTDRYGRTVALCEAGGRDLSCAMVEAGHAVERYGSLSCP